VKKFLRSILPWVKERSWKNGSYRNKIQPFGNLKRTDLFLLITTKNLGKFLVMLRPALVVRQKKEIAHVAVKGLAGNFRLLTLKHLRQFSERAK